MKMKADALYKNSTQEYWLRCAMYLDCILDERTAMYWYGSEVKASSYSGHG